MERETTSIGSMILSIFNLLLGLYILVKMIIYIKKIHIVIIILRLFLILFLFFLAYLFSHFYYKYEYTNDKFIKKNKKNIVKVIEYSKVNSIVIDDRFKELYIAVSYRYFSRQVYLHSNGLHYCESFLIDDEIYEYLIKVMPERQTEMLKKAYSEYLDRKEEKEKIRNFYKYP